jgi:hypothetical protein
MENILPFLKAPKIDNRHRDGHRDEYFKGQQANEELVCFFRKHWSVVVPQIGVWALYNLLVLSLVLLFPKVGEIVKNNLGLGFLYFGLVVLSTIYLHKIFAKIFAYFLNIVVFTNTRVIEHKKTLFLEDSHEFLDIIKVQDVRKYQNGFLENFLQYGGLLIVLSSSQAAKSLNHVPNVNFHFRCLARLKKDAFFADRTRRQEGLGSNEEFNRASVETRNTEQAVQSVLEKIE